MENIWIEDDLFPIENQPDDHLRDDDSHPVDKTGVKAVVRIAEPQFMEVKIGDFSKGGRYWLIKMRYEFETIKPKTEFIFANCQVYLEKEFLKDPSSPRVIEIFPQDLFDEAPQNIKIKLEPSLKFGFAQLSMDLSFGEVLSNEIILGRISSETKGFIGDYQVKPHWKLTPGKYKIEGIRDFFMLVHQPPDCQSISLRSLVEARIRNSKGIFHVGSRYEKILWEKRPRIRIG